jgi:hypothetical protein
LLVNPAAVVVGARDHRCYIEFGDYNNLVTAIAGHEVCDVLMARGADEFGLLSSDDLLKHAALNGGHLEHARLINSVKTLEESLIPRTQSL